MQAMEAVVTAVRPAGARDVVSLTVAGGPGTALAGARPGQLVVVPVDPLAGRVLPEVHWLAGVSVDPVHGTSMELLLDVVRGTAPGERMRLLGPLGSGFRAPASPVPTVLVGQGVGAVPLRWLAELLRARGCPVHVVLGADDPEQHLDLVHLRRHARSVVLALPPDLPAAVDRVLDGEASDAAVLYAAGPVRVLRDVAARGLRRGMAVRVAALDLATDGVVCGTGLCGTCDLPVRTTDRDGRLVERVLRPCLEGPVVPGEWLVEELR
ncbi:dihydroorotate dehydrogenase electron transfer subunit [Ornithinimicrobium humiphilum]|uniref:Dihydroorotate dehydrogenase electron transfer subunit n=1 Tax=Ornithinimicrobium humiphilum TaxID=125288 RepID=A0A543KPN9_9MICO|nr:dihydroorotate dehydrogenase electron transfer subunit [Ornithinimicrobium humiphilum]